MASISLTDVSLRFPIYSDKSRTLRQHLINASTGGRIITGLSTMEVEALRQINLKLSDGDRLGLKGNNGAGKSSLLRLLAGIYQPSAGSLEISGTIGTLFNLGTGLEDELSGLENILRLLVVRGMSVKCAEELTQEIICFCQLGEFLKLPVRTYSQGMRARLLFGVATATKPEILLIDEVFGAGDEEFQQRALKRLNSLIATTKIVVMATHNDAILNAFCTKVAVFDSGRLDRII